jgi:hypothetical protein
MVNGRAGYGDPAMGWRDRLTQVTEATVEAAVGEARGHATRAGNWLKEHDPSAAARLRLLAGGETRLSVEAFLVTLLDAMNAGDEDGPATAQEVEKAGRRRARRAGILGIFGGPAGLCAASLYAEAMLACDVVDRHGLDLSDEQIAAHLLALWGLVPSVEAGGAAIDGTGPSVAAQVLDERVFDGRPVSELSPVDALMVLWRARQLMDPDELPGTTKLRHFALPKRRVRRVTADLEDQLGVTRFATGLPPAS